jgi:hypothetical protein
MPESASVTNCQKMDPLMIALAMLEDKTCDSGLGIDEVFDDENDLEYGLVVDHTPPTPVPRLLTRVQTINSLVYTCLS